jgi:hypothetical protein
MWHDADAAALGLTRVVARTAHAAPRTPAWAVAVGIGLCVVLAMFWLGLVFLSYRRPPGREGDDDHGSGPGGGGPGRPGPNSGDAPGGAPTWWPDFEREFAAHVSEREAVVR